VLERRLVSRSLRPVVAVAAVLAAALVGVLAATYARTSSSGGLDGSADRWLITHFGAHVGLVRAVADLGGPASVVAMTAVLTAALLLLRRARGALLAVAAPTVATLLTEVVLKPLVGATHSGGASFPSGHATGFSAVVFVLLVLVLDQRVPRLAPWLQVVVGLIAAALVGCVCAALVAAQYHYFSDTLGGAGVALACVLTLALIVDGCADRRLGTVG
jgi:membrane-associated phospholipid phosphatase